MSHTNHPLFSDVKDPEKLRILRELLNAGIIPHSPASRPYPGHISPAEEEELAQCIKDRNQETKQIVLKAFIALPGNVRQHIIDSALWTRAQDAFREAAPKSKRHIELEEIKDPVRGMLKTQDMRLNERPAIELGGMNPKFGTVHLNPDILSLDDLMMAHAEQCLVEGITGELQKNQTEST